MVRNEEFTTTHLLYGDLIYPLCLPEFNFVLLTLYRPLVDHRLHTIETYLIFTSMKRYGFQLVVFVLL